MMPAMKFFRRFFMRPLIIVAALCASFVGVLGFMASMPGDDDGVMERELTAAEAATAEALRKHVEFLAKHPRNRDRPEHEQAVLSYLEDALTAAGWQPQRVEVTAKAGIFHSITARRTGTKRPDEIVVIGAHWDTHGPTPGADDNASGCAALLEIARWLGTRPTDRTVDLVFWANEEPPFFQTPDMGSFQHAATFRHANANVVVAISLEMLGYYDPNPGTQNYPPVLRWFYPDHGGFIAFVGSMWHRGVVTESVEAFREGGDFPAYGFAGPETMPGIGFSDQWSFWQHDYAGFMVTDTSFFRTPHYHQYTDLPNTLDYPRFARVVVGLRPVVTHWVGTS